LMPSTRSRKWPRIIRPMTGSKSFACGCTRTIRSVS
jgi:hypothetical protein